MANGPRAAPASTMSIPGKQSKCFHFHRRCTRLRGTEQEYTWPEPSGCTSSLIGKRNSLQQRRRLEGAGKRALRTLASDEVRLRSTRFERLCEVWQSLDCSF